MIDAIQRAQTRPAGAPETSTGPTSFGADLAAAVAGGGPTEPPVEAVDEPGTPVSDVIESGIGDVTLVAAESGAVPELADPEFDASSGSEAPMASAAPNVITARGGCSCCVPGGVLPPGAPPATDAGAVLAASTEPASPSMTIAPKAAAPAAARVVENAIATATATDDVDAHAAATATDDAAATATDEAAAGIGIAAGIDDLDPDDDRDDSAPAPKAADPVATAPGWVFDPTSATAPPVAPTKDHSGAHAPRPAGMADLVTAATGGPSLPADAWATDQDDTASDDDPSVRGANAVSASTPGPGPTTDASTVAPVIRAPLTTAPSGPIIASPAVNQGILRSEQVRVLRELAPNREVQRLAVDLDGARVALRFDADGARVHVVADPANRLGGNWAHDVQRTLNAGSRDGSGFQQRDPDGGRRNRHAYEPDRPVDEQQAAEFVTRLGSIQEG